MNTKIYKRVRRYIAISLSWLLILNSTAPTLILAEELASDSATIEQVTESPAPSTEPIPSPTPSPSPEAEVTTGDAYTTANATSEVDTTSVDSTVTLSSGDVIGTDQGDLVLTTPEATESAEVVAEQEPATESAEQNIEVDNEAKNETQAQSSSDTGGNNQTSSGNASTTTGDAVASAYATALTNNTLINSNVQVALLTIFSEWDGNLVLDPIDIDTEALAAAVSNLAINNEGQVVTTADATVVTGENFQVAGHSASMTTGEATAVSAAYANTNMTAVNAAIIDLLVQNIWLWSGNVRNMTAPGSVQTPSEAAGRTIMGNGQACTGCDTDLSVNNKSEVNTSASAYASTGSNTQTAGGSAEMNTGNAAASAIAYSMTNSTLVNSDYRLIALNLLVPWTGDIIFAYPDLDISVLAPEKVKEGEEINYLLTLRNKGYKVARPVRLTTTLTNLEEIPEIPALSSITRKITFSTTGKGGSTITFAAYAETNGGEESAANNSTEVATEVEKADSKSEEKKENTEVPKLTLTATNNVVNPINPGDGVQYEVKVTNTGSITSHDTKMVQIFVNEQGEPVQGITGGLGDIAINQTVTARFTLRTGNNLIGGKYHTETTATGYSDVGRETNSNTAINEVPVQVGSTKMGIIPEVQAAEKPEGDVLGQVAPLNTMKECTSCSPWWWYLAVGAASTGYFALLSRRWTIKRLIGNGLGIPLAGYGLFLLMNRDCAQGLTYVSSSAWCTWFLPVSDGIFAVPALITWKLLKTPLSRGQKK